MKILIGTTNPSKVNRFKSMLSEYDVEFYTLKDLNIKDEPQETGNSPLENSKIKAEFYGKFFDKVICNDSGLFIDDIPLDDKRQPSIHIRTPYGKRLNDEEMIEYYSKLANSLGGKIFCYYLDAITVFNNGKTFSFIEENAKNGGFFMVDKVHPLRHEGWPLDSISINKNTNTYFVEKGNNRYDTTNENIMVGNYRQNMINFFVKSLNLTKIKTKP